MLNLDGMCGGCSKNDCDAHLARRTVRDKITGLAFEVRCVCDHEAQRRPGLQDGRAGARRVQCGAGVEWVVYYA